MIMTREKWPTKFSIIYGPKFEDDMKHDIQNQIHTIAGL